MDIINKLKKVFKIHNKSGNNNKGAGMVTVMVAIVFIGIMATALCYMCYMNYLTKTMKYYATDNFYTDEYALSELTSALQEIVVSTNSIDEAIDNLALICTGTGSTSGSVSRNYVGDYLENLLVSCITVAQISIDDGLFEVPASRDKVIFHQVKITSTDYPGSSSVNNTYTSTIVTDIILTFSKSQLTAGVDVNDFSVITGADIDYEQSGYSTNIVFTGNLYSKGSPALSLKSGKTCMIMSDYAVFDGDVEIEDGSVCTINGKCIVIGNMTVATGCTVIVNGELKITGTLSGAGEIIITNGSVTEHAPFNLGTLATESLAEGLLNPYVYTKSGTNYEVVAKNYNSKPSTVYGLVNQEVAARLTVTAQPVMPYSFTYPAARSGNYRVLLNYETPLNHGDGALVFGFMDVTIREDLINTTIVTLGAVKQDQAHNFVMTNIPDEEYEAIINTCVPDKNGRTVYSDDGAVAAHNYITYYTMLETMKNNLGSGVGYYRIEIGQDFSVNPVSPTTITSLPTGYSWSTKTINIGGTSMNVTILLDANGDEVTVNSPDRFIVTDGSGKTYIPAGYLLRSESKVYISNILIGLFGADDGKPYASVSYANWQKL